MLTVEILITENTSRRGRRMLEALDEHRPSDVGIAHTRSYAGRCQWLMLFGAGGSDRYPAYLRHRASGRRTVVFDLGYWDRENYQRIAVDDEHPHRMMYRVPILPGRGYPVALRDDYDPTGPILFAGMGDKSRRVHGDWDGQRRAALAQDSTPIVFRPKPARKADSGLPPIELALQGCSKVVAHHSNVAIDGIIAGIPHDVVDGAALALKPTRDPVLRREFLDRLGAWNWRIEEAPQIWEFLRSIPEG